MINPIIFSIGSFHLFWYSIFLFFAVMAVIYGFWKRAKYEGYFNDTIFDIAFVGLFGSLIGGRLVEVVIRYSYFSRELLSPILFTTYPGFSYFGLILGGFSSIYFFCKAAKIRILPVFDLIAVDLSLGLVLVFIGHFINGSFFGETTKLPWGINNFGLVDKRHPTQLIAVFGFLLLTFAMFRFAKRKHFDGFLATFWLTVTSFIFLLVDPLRADSVYLRGVSVRFVFALILLLSGGFGYYNLSKKTPLEDLRKLFVLLKNRKLHKTL